MAFFNYASKEITLKVVYYGPGLSGKTTNLQHLYAILDPSSRGKFISLATEADRTLFFDFLPIDIGRIRDFSIRFQLYTVPGQIRYNATRRLVLKGADAVVFVADSQRAMRDQNIESYENMKENLLANNIDPETTPVVLQYNKRDVPNVLTIEELNGDLNAKGYQYLEAEAVNGRGVQDTFRIITRTLLKDISKKHKVDIVPTAAKTEPDTGAVPAEPVAELQRVPAVSPVETAPTDKEEPITVKIREKDALDLSESVAAESVAEAPAISPYPAEPQEALGPVERALRQGLSETVEPVERQEVLEKIWPAEPQEVIERKERAEPPPVLQTPAQSRPFMSDEKLAAMTEHLEGITRSLSMMKNTLSALSDEIKETKGRQAEIVDALIDIKIELAKAKRRKRWFFF